MLRATTAVVLLLVSAGLAGCAADESPGASLAGDWRVEGLELVRVADEATLTPVAWGWEEFGEGRRPLAIQTPPMDRAWQVQEVLFTGEFLALREANTSGASRGAFLLWISVDDRFVARALAGAPDTLAAGELRALELAFPLPVGGFYVPPGARVGLHLGSQYDDPAERLALRSGTIHASGIRIAAVPATTPAGAWHQIQVREGHSATDCASDLRRPVEGYGEPFDLPPDATALRATVTRGAGPGLQDMDVLLYAGDRLVAESQAPDGNETLMLGPVNLEAAGQGPWRTRVYCHSQQAPFTVVVEALRPVAP